MSQKRLTPTRKDTATKQYIHRLQDGRPDAWSRYMTLKDLNDLLKMASELYDAHPDEKSHKLYYKLLSIRNSWEEKEERYRELELLESYAIFDELPLAQQQFLTELFDQNMR